MPLVFATISTTLTALAVEAAFSYPTRIFAAIGHPVTWIGALIGGLERRLNLPSSSPSARRWGGVLALLLTLAVTAGIALLIQSVATVVLGAGAFLLTGFLASTLIAQRSLDDHVRRVERGLSEGLEEARHAVAQIVGRDPQALDEAGISRAAIESLAENFSDGIVAPVLYMAVLGLPGAAAYKAINTADSMIGHRSPRFENYGWSAARLDDWVNLPASRFSAFLLVASAFCLPGYNGREAARAVWRDARRHRSPNAGWPEAAMAGALGLRLAGPRIYDGVTVADAWMGNGRAEAGKDDVAAALRIYRVACLLQAGFLLMFLALAWLGVGDAL